MGPRLSGAAPSVPSPARAEQTADEDGEPRGQQQRPGNRHSIAEQQGTEADDGGAGRDEEEAEVIDQGACGTVEVGRRPAPQTQIEQQKKQAAQRAREIERETGYQGLAGKLKPHDDEELAEHRSLTVGAILPARAPSPLTPAQSRRPQRRRIRGASG